MNYLLKIVFAAVMLLAGSSAFSADYWSADPSGLASCEKAVKGSGVEFYTPRHKNPAQEGEVVQTFTSQKPGCLTMYVTREDGSRGMATVAVQDGAVKVTATGRKLYTLCHNFISAFMVVNFGSQVSELVTNPPQVGVVAGVQLRAAACDMKCQARKACDEINGTLTVNNGVWECRQQNDMVLISELNVSGRVESKFLGWTPAKPLNVPPAPAAQINMARPTPPDVNVPSCTSNCKKESTATRVGEVKSEFCGIATDRGDILALLEKGGRLQVVKNPKFARNAAGKLIVTDAEHDMVFNGVDTAQFQENCNAVQEAAETAMWTRIVRDLKIDTTCRPLQRMTPANNRFGSV